MPRPREQVRRLRLLQGIAPSARRFTSRPRVAGSQETYTTRWGAIWKMASTTSGEIPFRGGSTQITSGRSPRRASSWAAWPASAQRNSALSTPLRRALARASSTAAGMTSAPMARPACRAITRVMVPMPQ